MAIPIYIGGASGSLGGSASTSLTVNYSPTTGNAVLVFIDLNSSATAPSCKDSHGNSLTNGPTTTNTQLGASFYYIAVSGTTNFKVSWITTIATAQMTVVEYAQVSSIRAPFSGDTNTGSSNNANITSTTNVNNSVLVAGLNASSGGTWTSNVGNLRRGIVSDYAQAIVDNTVATAGSVVCSAHPGAATLWIALSIQLNPSALRELLLQGCGT